MNELDLEEGELLTVIEVSGTRWWEGRQTLGVHETRTGLFPISCVSTKVACVIEDNTPRRIIRLSSLEEGRARLYYQ